VLASAICVSVGLAHQAGKPGTPPANGQVLNQFKTAGKNASLTILPARVAGKSIPQVGEVVGLMLERAGMTNLEIGETELRLPELSDMGQTAKALGELMKTNPPKTDYTLFVDILGSYEHGVSEVRAVIVNKAGEVVWEERQTPSDADFRRIKPMEPIQCCLLVAQRLRPVLGLSDPSAKGALEGKIAKRLAEQSGVPSKSEFAEMQKRQRAFKKNAPTATILIYPARIGDEMSKNSADNLKKLISESKLMKANVAEHGPAIKTKGDINEQKMLWSMARAFREYVQKEKPDADYLLFSEYLLGKELVGAVHFTICDRQGQWVIVEHQNSNLPDFKAIQPKSHFDCNRLVVKRLEGYCR
jgi:hypothetical protein